MAHVDTTVSDTRARRDGRPSAARPSTHPARAQAVRAQAVGADRLGAGMVSLYALLGVLLAGYAVLLIVRANGASTTWLDGWGTAGYELVASLLVLLRAAVSPKDRGFCLALGTAMCLWALGDFAETYAGLHNPNLPTPILANYLWAGFFPLAYVGVMMLMRQEVRKFTAANYLDGVVATLTCAAAFAAFAFGAIQKRRRR